MNIAVCVCMFVFNWYYNASLWQMHNLEIFLIVNKPVGSFIQTTSKWANLNLFPNSWLNGPGLFRRWHLCVPQGLGLLRYSLEVSVNKIYEKLIKTELKMETKV